MAGWVMPWLANFFTLLTIFFKYLANISENQAKLSEKGA